MKLGIVGLPNVGKSTLFNAITNAGAESANYPFCTIDPNIGVVAVPDSRLDKLAEMYNPKKVTPAFVEFVDIAGLVKGASRGEGLGNKFLSHIRSVDAVVHVVRCFDDSNITHVEGSTDPLRDIEIIDTELILSDIEFLARQLDKTRKLLKGDKSLQSEVDFLEKLQAHLDAGNTARTFRPSDDREGELLSSIEILTNKPVLYAANMDEDSFRSFSTNAYYLDVLKHADPRCRGLRSGASREEMMPRRGTKAALHTDLDWMSRVEPACRKSYHLLG